MTPAEIKAFRARHGLSQAELARRLPVPLDTLRNWEQDHRNPPAYLARALADVERELSAAAPSA